MVNIANDILSLSDFKRRSAELIEQLKKTRRPVVLTVNGKSELVVLDAKSYQDMVERLELAESVQGIKRGLTSMREGKGRSLKEFDEYMRAKYSIPPDTE